ncbi:hypothetical protein [Granulicella tundricola]|nr:hypothetical protein [Granulicella tundricola]
MKTFALCLLACLMLAPMRIWSQSEQALPPEIRLELLPTAFADGVASGFIFVLTNVSGRDISIPPPEFNCSSPSQNGFIRFQWAFVPVNGDGIGSGISSCGPGGGIYPVPPLTVSSLTRNWTLLHPGESLRVPANWPPSSGLMLSGSYTFSASYSPPKISSEAEHLLSEAGIIIPRQKVETPEQHYGKP